MIQLIPVIVMAKPTCQGARPITRAIGPASVTKVIIAEGFEHQRAEVEGWCCLNSGRTAIHAHAAIGLCSDQMLSTCPCVALAALNRAMMAKATAPIAATKSISRFDPP